MIENYMNWWQLIWLRPNIFPSVPLRLVNPSKMFLEFFLVCWVNPELCWLSLKINYSIERINKKFFSGQELSVFHKKMSYWLIMRWSILMMCSKGTTVRSFLERSRQILSCTLVSFADPESLSNLLTTALLLNPGIGTFWNLRRQLLELGHLCPCDELHFSLVVLSFKPKCGDAFNYRRWILSKLFKGKLCDTVVPSVSPILSKSCTAHTYN